MTAVFGKMTSMVPNMSAFTQKMMGSSDKDLYGKFEDENTNFEKVNVDIDNLGREANSIPDGKKVQMEIPEGTEKLIKVVVPNKVKAGEEFIIQAGDGRLLKTIVPNGKGPGSVLWIPVPKKKEATNSIDQMADWLNKALPF